MNPRQRTVIVALVLAVASVTPDADAAVVRGPYLQRNTPTTALVRWRTSAASDSRVSYGLAPGVVTTTVDDPAVTTEHVVELTGLTPHTTYFYAIGSTSTVMAGGDADHFFGTSPTVATPTRIWVIGDSGTGGGNAADVRDAYLDFTGERGTDLWLMLGDNAYADGTDAQYQTAVFEMYPTILRNTFVWSTLGNHDGHSADSASQSGPYYEIFSFPRAAEAGGLASGTEAYYSFDYGNIHFICLDSYETNRAPGGPMMTWLGNDLDDTVAEWIIAFWHHPPYTKGSHDSDTEGRLIDMRQFALPILEAGGVDLVLGGHSHSYERSYLLDGHYGSSGTLTSAMVLDDGDGRPAGDGAYVKPTGTAHDGAVFVVAGSSGQTSGGALDHPAMFVALNQLGSLVLDVEGGRLDATFVRSNGVVGDVFTILKETPSRPGPAGNPVPATGAAGAPPDDVRLAWTPGLQADTHDVYFGTSPTLGPAAFRGTQPNPFYDPGPLLPLTTYYWRVDEVNDLGTTTGARWVFTTADLPALRFQDIETTVASSSASFTVNVPAGTEAGDFLLAVVAKERGGVIDTPPGWAVIDEGPAPDDKIRLGVFHRIAGGSEPAAYTFTSPEDKKALGAILRYCCAHDGLPIDVTAVAVDHTTTPTAPSVSATTAGAMIIRIFGAKDDDLDADPYPAGHDGRFALQSGSKVSGGVADTVQPAAGATAAAPFHLTASKEWRAVTVAVAPRTPTPCAADVDGDGSVAFSDLLAVVSAWGAGGVPADLDGDGVVGFQDLLLVLSAWGPCDRP